MPDTPADQFAESCRRGSLPLFCATHHDCRPWVERQRLLDEWAERHGKPRETPRGRST